MGKEAGIALERKARGPMDKGSAGKGDVDEGPRLCIAACVGEY